jgi:hypothetical protein
VTTTAPRVDISNWLSIPGRPQRPPNDSCSSASPQSAFG